jgi:hypothetical protein
MSFDLRNFVLLNVSNYFKFYFPVFLLLILMSFYLRNFVLLNVSNYFKVYFPVFLLLIPYKKR